MKNVLRKRFVAREWEETGEMGWDLAGCDSDIYDPNNYAPGLAHDVLEHPEMDSVADEMMAHAVMYWMRYETGYYWHGLEYGRAITLDDIGSEFINLYRAGYAEGYIATCEPQEPLEEHLEEDLAEIIEMGISHMESEFSSDHFDKERASDIARTYTDWFRRGYRYAENTYGKIGRARMCGIFGDLADLFRDSVRELYGEETLEISLDLESGELTFTKLHYCGECSAMIPEDSFLCDDCEEANSDD